MNQFLIKLEPITKDRFNMLLYKRPNATAKQFNNIKTYGIIKSDTASMITFLKEKLASVTTNLHFGEIDNKKAVFFEHDDAIALINE